jgi:hypothetical protein
MPKTRGTGLLMVWTDIDAQYEADFNQWYDEEHVPRLLKVPGFLSAGRYVALKGGPRHLAMYELEDHNVLKSADFLDTVRYKPSPGRMKISGGHAGRNYILNAYRQIFPTRLQNIENTFGPSPYLQIGRMDIAQTMEDEYNAWYNTCFIPGFLKVPGVLRARRFVAVDCVPKYMTVYEFERGDVSEQKAWNEARSSSPWNARMRPHLQLDEGSPAVFQRILPKL